MWRRMDSGSALGQIVGWNCFAIPSARGSQRHSLPGARRATAIGWPPSQEDQVVPIETATGLPPVSICKMPHAVRPSSSSGTHMSERILPWIARVGE